MVKIDVDGYESSVLKGALKSIRKYKPFILIEYCPHIHGNKLDTFKGYLNQLIGIYSKVQKVGANKTIHLDSIDKITPFNGSIDLLFIP